jgi:hypothetical protein
MASGRFHPRRFEIATLGVAVPGASGEHCLAGAHTNDGKAAKLMAQGRKRMKLSESS